MNGQTTKLETRANQPDKVAGFALIGAAVLSVAAMSHHPSGFDPEGGHLAEIVHAIMIAVSLVMLAGFIRVAARLGVERFGVLLGLVLFGAATLGNVLAACTNGFVAMAAARRGASPDIARLLWDMNQVYAYGAVYAFAASLFLFGAALLREAGAFARLAGVAGLFCGILPAALLVSGTLTMHVAGAFAIYAAQAFFMLLTALWLMRQK